MQQLGDALRFRALVLDGPQLRRKGTRGRLEQRRKINVIGAEAHAIFAQGRAGRLVKALDLLGHFLPLEHAEGFNELECDATRHAGHVIGGCQREQRRQQFLDVRLEPKIEPRLNQFTHRPGEVLVGDHADARTQGGVARRQFADQIAGPAQCPVRGQYDLIVGSL